MTPRGHDAGERIDVGDLREPFISSQRVVLATAHEPTTRDRIAEGVDVGQHVACGIERVDRSPSGHDHGPGSGRDHGERIGGRERGERSTKHWSRARRRAPDIVRAARSAGRRRAREVPADAKPGRSSGKRGE